MTKQIETATVVATITVAGNAAVVVTGAYIPNSPVTKNVAVGMGDNAAAVAAAIRAALALDGDITTAYVISGATDKVVLTDHYNRANDSTLNISVADGTCTGVTAAPTSANTQAGEGLTNAYATLAEFKAWRKMRGGATADTDASDDTVMEDILELVSRRIDNITGRQFWKSLADETRYYVGEEDTRVVKIDDLADDPTSVSVDYSANRSYTALASSDYEMEPANAATKSQPYTKIMIRPISSAFFPHIRRGVQVVGLFGWPAVPDNIKEDCLQIANNVYQGRTGQTSAGKITVTAAGIVIRPEDIPSDVMADLLTYRVQT